MIIGFEKNDIANWKADLKAYQNRKNTLFPEKQPTKQIFPTHSPKPNREQSMMQKYASAHLHPCLPKDIQIEKKQKKQIKRQYIQRKQFNYDKTYDIITLHSFEQGNQTLPNIEKKSNVPVRNIYDIINGQKLSEDFLKNRKIILPKQIPKKQLDRGREFNIINLEYKKDNTARKKQQETILQQQITKKCAQDHVYDNIYHRFYNPEEEERYWHHKKVENANLANQNFDAKLPPTYQSRERFIQDYTKPLPEPMRKADQRKQQYRRRHQIKHAFEQRYKIKNIEDADRKESRMFNRFHRLDSNLNKSALLPSSNEAPKIKSFAFD